MPVVAGAGDRSPPAQHGLYLLESVVDGSVEFSLVVVRQPGQIARYRDRLTAQRPQMLAQAREQTSDERDHQQRVDGGEPEAGEHVEHFESVQERAENRAGGDVLVDLATLRLRCGSSAPGIAATASRNSSTRAVRIEVS